MGSQHRWPCWLFWQPAMGILLVVIKFCSVLFCVQLTPSSEPHGVPWSVLSVVVSLYCVCRSIHSSGEKMLRNCDQCPEWFHQRCVTISEEMFEHLARTTANYSCPRCTGVNNVEMFGAAGST